MQIVCKSPYQSEISFKNDTVHVIGSFELINKLNELKIKFGSDPRTWPELSALKSLDDLLINEFIQKCQNKFKLAYEHAELCHCRMIPAERVYETIKQGCTVTEEVGRTTLAGTGCGTCRDDITTLLNQFKIS